MAIVTTIALIQFGVLITCFVNCSRLEAVASELWHSKFNEDTRFKFQELYHCFGYSNYIDISLTRYRHSCQDSFESVLRWRYLLISIILIIVIIFQIANLCIGFYLARQFPRNDVRKQELEILRNYYFANRG